MSTLTKNDSSTEVIPVTVTHSPPKNISQAEEGHINQSKTKTNGLIEQSVNDLDRSLINWDGDDDPANPLNWPLRQKCIVIILLGSLTLLTPFASSMFAPSVQLAMAEFNDYNETIGTLVVSIYLLGYAFGPLILAPLSELYGRVPLYHAGTVLFILFNLACARSTNFPMLIVFRFLSGVAGSCPITIGPGSISDMVRQEHRGKILAIWVLPILLGPSIGPIAGGYLSGSLGWRWDFWFLIIITGVVFIFCVLFLKETYAPAILEKKARRMRKETGDMTLQSALKLTTPPKELFLQAIVRPTKMLCTDPIVFGLSVVTAIVYGIMYLLFTTMSEVFEEQYSFSSNNVGLCYLGLGIGQIIGASIFGMVSDSILRSMAKGGKLQPEYRLPPLFVGTCFIAVGLIWYGWTAYFKVHWMVLIIGMVFIGAGVITSFMPVTTYLVDAYTSYAASATAANAFLRSIGGALLPLCGKSMYDALGLGWGNTLLAFLAMANLPLVFFFIQKGAAIRMKRM